MINLLFIAIIGIAGLQNFGKIPLIASGTKF